jgi:hypothetical protein
VCMAPRINLMQSAVPERPLNLSVQYD